MFKYLAALYFMGRLFYDMPLTTMVFLKSPQRGITLRGVNDTFEKLITYLTQLK
ncbi:hypothetical protein BH09BAC6_BH09BAC6_11510 [soil metagenome]|jgi:hypothetical protein